MQIFEEKWLCAVAELGKRYFSECMWSCETETSKTGVWALLKMRSKLLTF